MQNIFKNFAHAIIYMVKSLYIVYYNYYVSGTYPVILAGRGHHFAGYVLVVLVRCTCRTICVIAAGLCRKPRIL